VPDPGSGRQPTQKALREADEKTILAALPTAWQASLTLKAPQNPDKYTVLGYQLYRYTKKNTSDYFIHKDLGGFLRRELNFFIKNEVLFLDDLEGRQLEQFQAKLFLKHKAVHQTSWLVPLKFVPDELLSTVASSLEQRDIWVRLFRIDQTVGDLAAAGYTEPLTLAFLKEHGGLPVDTTLFPTSFTRKLLEGLPPDAIKGTSLLVHAENLQALRLLA
jgi:adenine-specific DNA-methyltransferase